MVNRDGFFDICDLVKLASICVDDEYAFACPPSGRVRKGDLVSDRRPLLLLSEFRLVCRQLSLIAGIRVHHEQVAETIPVGDKWDLFAIRGLIWKYVSRRVSHQAADRFAICRHDVYIIISITREACKCNLTAMRDIYRSAIFEIIRREGSISRSIIAERLDISLPTVMRIVDELVLEGFVSPHGTSEWSGGRRRPLLEFNSAGFVVLGVDMRRIGCHLRVNPQSAANYAKAHAEILPPAPVPEKVEDAELDELFTFIGDKELVDPLV